eukprot:TRINITY_DN33590_c0_g1_i1.p1 TRINITY_DN33590_c0_g1~~TRINITY_DN33590_c0_g1_i1.p1  ORF type:complete len:636 (+),score=119.88 TRINITY_DN33590_c0_g1_i1:60-1967(+)
MPALWRQGKFAQGDIAPALPLGELLKVPDLCDEGQPAQQRQRSRSAAERSEAAGRRLHAAGAAQAARRAAARAPQQAAEQAAVRRRRRTKLRGYLDQRGGQVRVKDPLEPRRPQAERWACRACGRLHYCRTAAAWAESDGGESEESHGPAVLSSTAARAVARALRNSKGVCAEKQADGQGYKGGVTAEAVLRAGNTLRLAYERKEGDVIDELACNLKAPEEIEAGHAKPLVLAAAARHLHMTRGGAAGLRGRSAVELLVLALYTMAGPDIDALMTYPDVPEHDPGDTRPWQRYVTHKSPTRNAAIFSTVNWAMRTAESGDEAALDTIRRWSKYLGLLHAFCCKGPGAPRPLARGLAGLPREVVEKHARLQQGDMLHWAAPSSCALDPRVSESYVRGAAANAVKHGGGSVLFSIKGVRCGLPLQAISKYPGEAEVLLPPFTHFKVLKVRPESGRLPGTVLVDLECTGTVGTEALSAFVARCVADAASASLRVEELGGRTWERGRNGAVREHALHTRNSSIRARSRPHESLMHQRVCRRCAAAGLSPADAATPRRWKGPCPPLRPDSPLLRPTQASASRARSREQSAEVAADPPELRSPSPRRQARSPPARPTTPRSCSTRPCPGVLRPEEIRLSYV